MSQFQQTAVASDGPEIRPTGADVTIKLERGNMPAAMVVAQDGFDGAFERRFSYIAPDKSLAIGTWECGPGTLVCDAYPNEEYCLVLQGVVAITNASGSKTEYRPGDSFILPKGWRGRWEMKTRFKKQFAVVDWDFG